MRTLFFTIVLASLLNLPQATQAQCYSYKSNQLVERYENKIMGLLCSSGDTNVYSKVLDCDYYSSEDTWVIRHTISFNGFWSGDFYKAEGKLIIGPDSWDWKLIDLNDNLFAWLLLCEGGKALIEASQKTSGTVEDVKVDYNVYENGKKGMRIHMKVNIYNGKADDFSVVAYFYNQNGTKLKGYNGRYEATDNQVCAREDITPRYDSSVWKDLTIFFPYEEFEINSSGKSSLYFSVGIYQVDGWKHLATSSNHYMTYG